MISKYDYIKNPCSSLPIPYWKEEKVSVPDNMLIIHDKNYNGGYLDNYDDTKYFRILHDMKLILDADLDINYYIKTVDINKEKEIVTDIINNCYSDISVTESQVVGWTKEKVYDRNLWIFIMVKNTNLPVGLGIADFDKNIKEGILEWIQVLPKYRCKGIGKAIVNELLNRLEVKAEFVTVSGKIDNKTKPESLYRKCGFKGNDIWNIMYYKK